jgi:hypothetical protein
MQSPDKRVEVVKRLRITEADREHTLEMAEHVWQKVKGYPIPEQYSEEDRLSIFERYYHRAVAQSQGE